jgi:DNA-binding response OmpR family regulator
MMMKNRKDIDNNNKKVYRILLVDDEPEITLSLNKVLDDNGFEVDAFNNPIFALSSFKQGLYALTLIDLNAKNEWI